MCSCYKKRRETACGKKRFWGAALGKGQSELFFGRSPSKIEGGKRVIEPKQIESSITQSIAVDLNGFN